MTLCNIALNWEKEHQRHTTKEQKATAYAQSLSEASSMVLDDDPDDGEAVNKIIALAYTYPPRTRPSWERIINDLHGSYNIIYSDDSVIPPNIVSVTLKKS